MTNDIATDAPPAADAAWIADARARFRRFADALDGPPLVASHDDADGLSSAALLARAFGRAGPAPEVRLVGRGENAWADPVAAELRARGARGLVVADLGVRAETPGGALSPLLAVIDHHVPRGAPEGAVLVHGHGLEPTPTSSLLAWWCAQGLLGEEAADDLLWLAAVGLIGDLGDKAPFGALGAAKKRFGAGRLRELTTLVNAPRRAGAADARPALEWLLRAEDPRDALEGGHPERDACQAAREEVNAALAEGRRQPPRFGGRYGGEVALIRLDSPCQIHPLVAQSWVRRLKGQIVFAANVGFLPGHVSFAGRAKGDADITEFLARHRPEGADPVRYGNGHARASGGTLPVDAWNRLVDDLGFGAEMRA